MADLSTQYPTNPTFNGVKFTANNPAQVTETFTGKSRRVSLGVTYYSWEVSYPTLTPLQAGVVKGYLAQALGQTYSFEIVIPRISYSALGTTQTSNVPQTSAAAVVGATSIGIDGCGANALVLAAGDYFKFANHSKVYQATVACVANASGIATMFFSGPLLSAVPNNTNLTITAVPFTAIASEDAQEHDIGLGGMTSMSVAMREVF
jgi:hypothetical protein